METVIIPESESPRTLPFYLALEEWLARKHTGRDFFFMWQVEPTVIIGRHQMLRREVDVDFCMDHGIDIVRRKSGGGAVVADMDNLMMSYVTTSDEVTTTFTRYTSMVTHALQVLGLDARDTARNDILIGDRKVSGNSFYHLGNRSIVHGTLLYDFNPALMEGAITPDRHKLRSHGVSSVHSRVTTIKSHLPEISAEEVKKHILSHVTEGIGLRLTIQDLSEIERIADNYRSPKWLAGKDPKATCSNTAYLDGVGTLSVHLDIDRDRIRRFDLTGDYLSSSDDVPHILASLLTGISYNRPDISLALDRIDTSQLIVGLKKEDFINLIC